jgi:biotin carboxyl carrier protein
MTFDIDVNGQSRIVSIERAAAGRYRLVVDGHPTEVDAARVGAFGLSLLLDGATASSREVQVAPTGSPGEVLVWFDGRSVPATINGRRTGRGGADVGAGARGDQAVVAPMPGRVVRVLVAAGDQVTARQPVVVVEAMKMENELRSPKAGTVTQVTAAEGMSVEAGAALLVIE